MTTEIATRSASQNGGGEIMERVIAAGDLSKLTPADRSMYYAAVCESIGLNPLTRPFEYITLNGKLTLYANKGCTDQLRSIRGVSVDITRRDRLDDLYVVTATATDTTGRKDTEIGAVSIGGLRGDALANAMMKATTKAKRRVTLSICGLGLLDESELDSIPPARRQPFAESTTADEPDAAFLRDWDEAIMLRGFRLGDGRNLLKAALSKRGMILEEADAAVRAELIDAAKSGKFDKLKPTNGTHDEHEPEPPIGETEAQAAPQPSQSPPASTSAQDDGTASEPADFPQQAPAPGSPSTPQAEYEAWLATCREAAQDSGVTPTELDKGISGLLAAKQLTSEPWRLSKDLRDRTLGDIAARRGLFAAPKKRTNPTGA